MRVRIIGTKKEEMKSKIRHLFSYEGKSYSHNYRKID
jgi:hypothetical protein